MKRSILTTALLLFALFSLPSIGLAQRTDLKGDVDAAKGLIPITRANTAATGVWVDLANYNGAMVVVQSGLMDAASQYIVLQDSVVGSAVALKDSIDIGPDSTTSAMAYRGNGRFIRVVLRASGNAADSSWASATILRSGKRVR